MNSAVAAIAAAKTKSRLDSLNIIIFILLSFGIIVLFLRVLTDNEDWLYKVLTIASTIIIGSGVTLMMLDNVFRGLFVLGLIVVLAILANGLESDKRYLRKIYKEVEDMRVKNPNKNDKEIMEDLFNSRFPKISSSVREEIINESEDFEDMLLRSIEFNSSGKISKSPTIDELERENDAT